MIGLAASLRPDRRHQAGGEPDSEPERAERAFRRISRAADLAASRYETHAWVDSALRGRSARNRRDPAWDAQYRQALAIARGQMRQDSAAIRVELHTAVMSSERIMHLLPEPGDSVCRVFVQSNDTARFGWRGDSYIRRNVPGLCGLITEFGLPGDSVRGWLLATRARYARDVNWARPTYAEPVEQLTAWDFRNALYRWYRANEEIVDAPEARCMMARAGACAQMVMEHSVRDLTVDGIPGAVSITGYYWFDPSPAWGLMKALIREQGKERFGAFWRSNEAVPVAFAGAFGQPLDEWVRGWMQRTVVRRPRDAAVVPSIWLGTLLFSALLGGVGAAYASRRTISS